VAKGILFDVFSFQALFSFPYEICESSSCVKHCGLLGQPIFGPSAVIVWSPLPRSPILFVTPMQSTVGRNFRADGVAHSSPETCSLFQNFAPFPPFFLFPKISPPPPAQPPPPPPPPSETCPFSPPTFCFTPRRRAKPRSKEQALVSDPFFRECSPL